MKRLLPLLVLPLFLTACGVDTTGINAQSSRGPAGNANASVVVTEYADLECPACGRAYDIITKPLLEKYKTQIRYEYKHFPLRSIHRYTMELAEAAECAADQGKFWEYVDFAFTNQKDLKPGIAKTWGQNLVENDDLFNRCTDSHMKRDTIMSDYKAGVDQGVQGTPTFFVNGKQVPATLEALSAAIDEAEKGAQQRL